MDSHIRAIRVVFALATAATFLTSCGQAATIKKPVSSNPTTENTLVTVYDVVGQPLLSAAAELGSHHLRVNVTTLSQCSNVFPLNEVVAETPSVGTRVPRGTQVSLTTSSGSCVSQCPYVYMDSLNQVQCSPSPVLTDPSQLAQALSTAGQTLMGTDPPQDQYSEFILQFDSLQEIQEREGALVHTWYTLDPTSEASDFINLHDRAAAIARGAAQYGSMLNCIISGSQNCSQTNSP